MSKCVKYYGYNKLSTDLILFTFLLRSNVLIGLSNEANLILPSPTFVAMVTKFATT